MPSVLPHTKHIQRMTEQYLADTDQSVRRNIDRLGRSAYFRRIYRISLAAEAVLSGISTSKLRPPLSGIRSIVLRIPLLAAVGQRTVAEIELRRFVELAFWIVYFTDHPVEWETFRVSPERGFARDLEKPIEYFAHRELVFYANYARERMLADASGISADSVVALRELHGGLSASVHPAGIAGGLRKVPPFEDVSQESLQAFANLQRRVFAGGCVLLSAFNRRRFNRLGPASRAHFDWLLGSALSKRLRKDVFGLP